MKTTLGDWLDGITELSKSLQQIDIDASAYACLAALILVNGNSGNQIVFELKKGNESLPQTNMF